MRNIPGMWIEVAGVRTPVERDNVLKEIRQTLKPPMPELRGYSWLPSTDPRTARFAHVEVHGAPSDVFQDVKNAITTALAKHGFFNPKVVPALATEPVHPL